MPDTALCELTIAATEYKAKQQVSICRCHSAAAGGLTLLSVSTISALANVDPVIDCHREASLCYGVDLESDFN
ncbi:unnamed protein product [Arctia plantaginis]|uniref:Uncharacterized protein n=1 Tax=Arctia plantaginis TaxID=874455 RepID=A0A8S0YPS2_ARCPL|nr:unnamed protein product [Arctia plantaginis]